MLSIEEFRVISEGIGYNLLNDQPMWDCPYRYGSREFLRYFRDLRSLKLENLSKSPLLEFFLDSDLGHTGVYRGKRVALDMPLPLSEAKYQGEDVELNKPKRGGSKKFYVYVKDGDKVKKVSFGAKDGGQNLAVKFKDPEARQAFSDRHNCPTKKDKTTPGYWSCNLPKYAKALGLGPNMNVFW